MILIRPGHDMQVIAHTGTHAITHANQEKGGCTGEKPTLI